MIVHKNPEQKRRHKAKYLASFWPYVNLIIKLCNSSFINFVSQNCKSFIILGCKSFEMVSLILWTRMPKILQYFHAIGKYPNSGTFGF